MKINCTVKLRILENMQDFMKLMKRMLEKYLIHPQILANKNLVLFFKLNSLAALFSTIYYEILVSVLSVST